LAWHRGAHSEDVVDLGAAQPAIALGRLDHQPGSELYLRQQLVILQRHVQLMSHHRPLPTRTRVVDALYDSAAAGA
jgi:hypothetical protein